MGSWFANLHVEIRSLGVNMSIESLEEFLTAAKLTYCCALAFGGSNFYSKEPKSVTTFN